MWIHTVLKIHIKSTQTDMSEAMDMNLVTQKKYRVRKQYNYNLVKLFNFKDEVNNS